MGSSMSEEMIRVEHLKKAYDENVVLEDISLSVNRGEVLVILGPSGCGKSTLLRCLNGLEPVQGGEITCLGEKIGPDAGTRQLSALRQKVGMVFQSYELFPHKTIIQNVMLAPLKVQKRDKKEVREEALSLLDRVCLKDKAEVYPRQLSGGQRQRVAIVRALAMHPEVILFDEVTAALDPEMIREVLEVLLRLAEQGNTMVIVTHEMAFARAIADRVIFLDKGRIVEEAKGSSFFHAPKTERARQFLDSFSYEKVQKKIRKTG